ncbi:unnamed protein product [Chironomus riparius]|uniref:Uncharacterized protein n=1 Tax=Chironomus riparius TaxID=315576 RepID=A0A9N9WY74_9DIPT|nr:unnamed protein product [Chironomus riparius]
MSNLSSFSVPLHHPHTQFFRFELCLWFVCASYIYINIIKNSISEVYEMLDGSKDVCNIWQMNSTSINLKMYRKRRRGSK